jgi:crotonobetainyl-CoA:carnitine CoA-transferase CaiB-like acyl-CoA transferase
VERRVLVPVKDPIFGYVMVAQAQHKMTETPIRIKWVCRPAGYDNGHVFLKYFGYGPAKLAELKEGGLI